MPAKVQVPARIGHTDEELAFIREMGVRYLNLNVMPADTTYETLAREQERLAHFDLEISDLACPPLQKNPSIILGRADRDEQIQQFQDFVRLSARLGVKIVSVAWQPNGIFRTGRAACPHTRGGVSAYADLEEIESRPIANDRVYPSEEMWDTFLYFLERMLPVCESCGVRMALHPNDPPVPSLGGVASLIYRSADYDRAFALANQSSALGMKLCVGCWLEGGDRFGDLMEDIRRYCQADKILVVHFRNVSSKLPRFEETLCEDGYANMYAIMKQFVRCGFQGYFSIDHAFAGHPSMGGMLGAFAYPTGFLKGLLWSAEEELHQPHDQVQQK
ncbi:mannonate dehydratase [uncultured Gemmiger sp.]|uniref:mannonate dehydratase n=1 Tax=uncultured Gemmiger sp. TaxID=1623490 RepID=UPI0025E05AFF|nr:mannonate dehydratase [uncultured Gemmiger sp.]